MSAIASAASEDCSAVAYYGISRGARAATSFYHTAIEWFNGLGCPPDRISVDGPGHSGKLGSFARGDAKLRKAGFDGVQNLELVSSTPGARTGSDFYLTANYDQEAEGLYAYFVARSSLATLSATSMLPLARTVAQELKPAYGIGYTREHRLGPALYAVGICQGLGVGLTGEAYEEARNISRWCDMGMVEHVYRDGLLRDVYPWNFLTEPHLARQVGGVPLERWIQQGAGRGKISPFCDSMSLWEVNASDMPQVRAALRQAGAIFDWRKHG